MTTDWQLKPGDLKRYPHFDKYLPPDKAVAVATDPKQVACNPFYPFLRYTKGWRPYRPTDKPEKKRPIRYASRRDAYIFARYRHLLAEAYEAELVRRGITQCPIAYRKIPVNGEDGPGKCNINFSKDAFDRIRTLAPCSVIALDISSYFENIDHSLLHKIWCELLGVADLPPDHAAVFRAITKYAVVDRDKLYERLGIIGPKVKNGKLVRGYLKSFREIPMQLCTPAIFRAKVAGGDPTVPSIIETNHKPFGIPQGAPISDILANIYLIDFDVLMDTYARGHGGCYFRYSDDILLIVPGGAADGLTARDHAMAEISKFGSEIKIKPAKTSVLTYKPDAYGRLGYTLVDGSQGKNGLEYLGFRFDGQHVYLRDSTLSGFYRKITLALRHEARAFVARYPGKTIDFLTDNFNIEAFIARFGRVEDFDPQTSHGEWTFWTYARRAASEFGLIGQPIYGQISRHRELIWCRLRKELEAALS
ncbi:reverse transcriptase domain-containing protein [Telmatospirillum sp.]|uniref:reverse transcriptase domain-containing protein n=1 Tax=Telmatospirillum sp. TaxID=2079197 RepID=UPI00283D4D52|nr:reverse transcriptase domain-containing protein [Telmatospirillum sp.]MDR3440857.1 reverse transcriptase domain-containing protein [Telmatospirillum sp.]